MILLDHCLANINQFKVYGQPYLLVLVKKPWLFALSPAEPTQISERGRVYYCSCIITHGI